jgi:hypothetical protein
MSSCEHLKNVLETSYKRFMNFVLIFCCFIMNFLWKSLKCLLNFLWTLYCLTNFLQTSDKISYELLTNILQTSHILLTNVLQISYKLLKNFLQTSNGLWIVVENWRNIKVPGKAQTLKTSRYKGSSLVLTGKLKKQL